MNATGKHLILELKDCSRDLLDNLDFLKDMLILAASKAGSKVLGEAFHKFTPQGVTGVVIIAESHLSIHTWPEYGYAAVDFFTCGEEIDPFRGFDLLREKLSAERFEVQEFFRGRIEPLYGKLPHKPSLAEI